MHDSTALAIQHKADQGPLRLSQRRCALATQQARISSGAKGTSRATAPNAPAVQWHPRARCGEGACCLKAALFGPCHQFARAGAHLAFVAAGLGPACISEDPRALGTANKPIPTSEKKTRRWLCSSVDIPTTHHRPLAPLACVGGGGAVVACRAGGVVAVAEHDVPGDAAGGAGGPSRGGSSYSPETRTPRPQAARMAGAGAAMGC